MKNNAWLLAALLLVGPAVSVGVSAADPAGDRAATTILSISPVECQLTSKDQSTLTWFREQGAFYWTTGFPDSLWVNIPLQIPHKAVVKGLTVYCTINGNGPDDEIEFYLSRQKMISGASQKMATITTTILTPSPSRRALADDTIDYATVDNNVYSYALVLRFRSGSDKLKFHGAKIRYIAS
ncbi:MAG: hypothetical protein JW742_02015 [Candidatus Aminicenantes bacterium]|nr:hypothetical protein [Candidatus Aminicenantes bacterium]